ncbi:hypothetical protein EIP86_006977 [Pleurotus ostreatoroseus]|nr:hypothetical protein EIP86_006977 [Pleurotus ostreatoroseus]
MSSSLVELMHENEEDGNSSSHISNRYSYDPLDRGQPPSPSSGSSERDLTPPYLARSLPSRGSSTTTSTRRRHRRHDDRHRDDEDEGESSAKLLARLVSRFDQRDVKHVRTLLLITNDRLDSETRRADQAEQRVVDALHRLRTAHEATSLAQADAVRAKQEVQMCRLQLDQALHERTSMQEIIDQLEQSLRDAEDESARARSVARKLREELLSSKAREQGRKEGFEEGFARGRAMGLADAQNDTLGRKRSTNSRPPPRRTPPVQIEVSDESPSESRSEDSPPIPVPAPLPQRRPPSAPTEALYAHRVTPPVRHTPPLPKISSNRPPSTRPVPPPAQVHVPDVAPIVQTLPVPTITTPLNAPSPSHSRPTPPEHRRTQLKTPSPPRRSKTPAVASPQPLPVPMPASLTRPPQAPSPVPSRSPAPSRTPVRKPAPAPVPPPAPAAPPPRTPDPVPIPIHNAMPSPRHPHVDLLPDGYIPYAANHDTSSIVLPPAHELSRPVSPIEVGPNGIPKPPPPDEMPDDDDSLESLPFVPPPQSARSVASLARSQRYAPSVASSRQGYGYGYGGGAPLPMKPPSTGMNSPQSRPSTLSHYDLLGPPRKEAVYRQGVDRETVMAGQGPPDRVYTPRSQLVEQHDRDSQSTWDKLFKKPKRSKRSIKGKEREYVPDIFVESPSTPNSSSKPATAVEPPEPHLLSPEHARTPVVLPTLTDILSPPDSQSARPIPIHGQSPRYIPATSPRPVPHESPLPVPPPLPAKAYPSYTYAAAPVPEGVVYPAPPGRPQSRASTSGETGEDPDVHWRATAWRR